MKSLGIVEEIAASGKACVGSNIIDINEMLFRDLRTPKRLIRILSFSTGHKKIKTYNLFKILENKIENLLIEIGTIINDDKNDKTVTPYARRRIENTAKRFSDGFFPQYFKQTKSENLNKILHAKIIVIDRKSVLIGSANLSKRALESNYEIMVKMAREAVVKLSKMPSYLAKQIRDDAA